MTERLGLILVLYLIQKEQKNHSLARACSTFIYYVSTHEMNHRRLLEVTSICNTAKRALQGFCRIFFFWRVEGSQLSKIVMSRL